MALTKYQRRLRIKQRIRKKINGTSDKPRFSVFRSNKHIYAQIIDDVTGVTLVAASSIEKEISAKNAKNATELADFVGAKVAEKAKSAGIETVSFDRGGYKFHGRVKALADAARKGGLKF